MSEIRNTLNERGGRYGRFDHHAATADALIQVVEYDANLKERDKWFTMAADQKHAIRYILDKIARIIEGDPDYTDNWHDIAGYATLIEDRLNGTGLYAPEPRLVRLDDCFEPGSITTLAASQNARCRNCHAKMGDVHAPDCNEGQEASPTG